MDDRRTLEELLLRYEFEPGLCDIYVEGSSDKAVIEQFFEDIGRTDVAVYSVETVNVPRSTVLAEKLPNNNRGRVIAVGRKLAEALGTGTHVSCVVDADFDHFLNVADPCPLIVMTDYASMDMYFFDANVLRKFLRVCFDGFALEATELMEVLQPLLEQLFLVRLTNLLMDLNLTALSFDRCCAFKDDGVAFDTHEYVKRYLNRNGKLKLFEEFCSVMQKQEANGSSVEPRMKMHGHDFTEALAWLVKVLKPKSEIQGAAAIARVLRACADAKWLREQGLFTELSARCGV